MIDKIVVNPDDSYILVYQRARPLFSVINCIALNVSVVLWEYFSSETVGSWDSFFFFPAEVEEWRFDSGQA